jgi:uncharacterized protein YecE (DUF72 family)
MTYCGVSGWAHPDWNSVVYPAIRPRGFHPLEHLAQVFDFVEVDASYQRPLKPELTRLWMKKLEGNPNFRFSVQVGQPFTTEVCLDEERVNGFKEGLWPIFRAKRLASLLFRFPCSFRFTRQNRDAVIELRRAFHEFPLAAEFRHTSWSLDEAIGTLMDFRIGFCNLDQPAGAKAMSPSAWVTSPIGYVRLLGRGGEDWTDERAASNYLYSPQELGQWQARIERISSFTQDTFVVFANSAAGKSVVNALQMSKMLAEPAAVPKRRVERVEAMPMPSAAPTIHRLLAG